MKCDQPAVWEIELDYAGRGSRWFSLCGKHALLYRKRRDLKQLKLYNPKGEYREKTCEIQIETRKEEP